MYPREFLAEKKKWQHVGRTREINNFDRNKRQMKLEGANRTDQNVTFVCTSCRHTHKKRRLLVVDYFLLFFPGLLAQPFKTLLVTKDDYWRRVSKEAADRCTHCRDCWSCQLSMTITSCTDLVSLQRLVPVCNCLNEIFY